MSKNFAVQSASRIPPLAPGLAIPLLGIMGDLLFTEAGLGLNVALWVAWLAWAWWRFRLTQAHPMRPDERRLLLLVLALGAGWAWRENETLRVLDTLGLGVSFGLLALAARPAPVALTPGSAVGAMLGLAGRGAVGWLPVLADAGRDGGAGVRHLGAVARGALVAVPSLVVFGALLASADEHFAATLASLVQVDLLTVARHVVIVLALGWLAAALVLGTRARGVSVLPTLPLPTFGSIEVTMALGPLCLLFLTFVGFQVSYLFGGAAYLQQVQGMSLAEYARKGFEELCMVSGLGLPFLLALEALVPAAAGRPRRLFRVLGGSFVALLLVVMGSALHRMLLYQREFGLTQDRLFATALIGGIAVTAAWFVATALQGATERFMRGAVAGWVVWLAMLHAINPQALIVEANVRRAEAGRALDASYLASLGNDAVPALVAALPRLSAADRAWLTITLDEDRRRLATDPRGWTVAQLRADRSLAALRLR